VLFVVALNADVASAAAPSPAPGYLADDYHELALASNNLMSGAKPVDKAYPVRGLVPKAQPESGGPIWTFHCPAAAESVKFSRSVWLPGPPNYGGSFTYGTDVGRSELGSVTSIDLIVNGNVIVHEPLRAYSVGTQGTTQRVPLDAAAVKAFRYEQNTIQVRVHKRKTPGGCNKADPATRVGVWFTLAGQFQTDLALNPPGVHRFRKLAPNQAYTAIIGVDFRNDGPAWEPTGTFWVDLAGAGVQTMFESSTPSSSPSLVNCQANNVSEHRVTCGLSDFAPSTQGLLYVTFQVKAPPNAYSDFSVAFTWYIGAGAVTDLNSSNNSSSATYTFCGSTSTNPGCQSAS
jgi:hypothetical protein